MYPIKIKEFSDLLEGKAFISTDNKTYRIEALTEVESIQADVKKCFTKSLSEMDEAFRHSYDELLVKQKRASEEGHIKGFKTGLKLEKDLPKGWELGSVLEDKFVITRSEIVYAKNIKKNNESMVVPKSLAKKFYIKNIKLFVNFSNKIYGGKGTGYSPHLSMNIPTDEHGIPFEGFEPDLHTWDLCIGDINGKDLCNDSLLKLEKALTIINLDSAFGGIACREAEKLFIKGVEDKRTKQTVWDTHTPTNI